jgi:hypothetical protein
MDELGPEARALLDAAREGLSPDPAAIRRVHGRIHAAASGAAVGTALGAKLGVAGLIAAIAIGAAFYLQRGPVSSPVPSPAAPPSVERARPPARAEGPERAVGHAAAPTAVSDEDLITIEPATAPVRRRDPRGPTSVSPRSPRDAAPAPGAPRVIELGREVALIDLAMAALRRSDAAAALRAMQEYAAEAGDAGQLRQDAAAIEIEALCKLGDPGARDKRAAFDARFPHSAQRARLEAACR